MITIKKYFELREHFDIRHNKKTNGMWEQVIALRDMLASPNVEREYIARAFENVKLIKESLNENQCFTKELEILVALGKINETYKNRQDLLDQLKVRFSNDNVDIELTTKVNDPESFSLLVRSNKSIIVGWRNFESGFVRARDIETVTFLGDMIAH